MDSDLDAGLFDEPEGFRPPTPPLYNPEPQSYSLKEGGRRTLALQLVSTSPLWGHVLYPSSICLARYLEEHPELVRGRRCLELGAGAGLPGLVAGCLEAEQVVITDYPDANLVSNLEHNVKVNSLEERCQARGFVWGTNPQPLLDCLSSTSDSSTASTPGGTFDVLFLADLVFNHSQHDALLRTCEEVTAAAAPDAVALCFYAHHRPTAELIQRDERFLQRAQERGWDVELVVENPNAGLAFPEDGGDATVRATVKGWLMKRRQSSAT